MTIPLRRVRRGQPLRDRDHNAIVDALLRSGTSGADLQRSGRVLGLAVDDHIWARLTGTTSPYSFTQVVGIPGGGWATPTNARAGMTAYEANATAGLGGKVARLERGYKDWRFTFRRRRAGVGATPCPAFPPSLADLTLTLTYYGLVTYPTAPDRTLATTLTWVPGADTAARDYPIRNEYGSPVSGSASGGGVWRTGVVTLTGARTDDQYISNYLDYYGNFVGYRWIFEYFCNNLGPMILLGYGYASNGATPISAFPGTLPCHPTGSVPNFGHVTGVCTSLEADPKPDPPRLMPDQSGAGTLSPYYQVYRGDQYERGNQFIVEAIVTQP